MVLTGGPGGGAGGVGGAGGQGGSANQGRPPMQPRPKFLPHGKKAQARGGAVAFVFEEVMAANVGKVAKVVEWLGDTWGVEACLQRPVLDAGRPHEGEAHFASIVGWRHPRTRTPPGQCT